MFRKITIVAAAVLGGITLLILLTTAALYITRTGDYAVPATTAGDPSLPVIALEGYPFHGETSGDPQNPAVIVLHGGPGGDYRGLLPLKALSDEYFLVFYDQRGSGLSPRTGAEELTLERYLADLDLFVDEFVRGGKVMLIGHSWGAMLASAYIGRHPEKVSRAVLAEPGFLDQAHREIFNERTGLADLKPTPRIVAALSLAWAESLHVRPVDSQARRDYLVARFFTTPMDNHPLAGYYRNGDITNAVNPSWRFGALASTSVPASGIDGSGRLTDLAAGVNLWDGEALFLAGSENTIIGAEYQRGQMTRFPRARLVVIEGAGHTMFGEKPAESVAAVRSFLGE